MSDLETFLLVVTIHCCEMAVWQWHEPGLKKFRSSYYWEWLKVKPYSIAERRVLELIPVLGSQPAGDVSHKPGGKLPLHSARPAVTPETLRGTMGVNSLPETVTRHRCDCDLNPGPSAPESSTLTTRLLSHTNGWPLI